MERCISEAGQEAITHYKLIKKTSGYSVLSVKIETGRTHQIRVHMAYIEHPILGDSMYGKESTLIKRQALHSYRTSFIHPITNEPVSIVAPIPEDMKALIT